MDHVWTPRREIDHRGDGQDLHDFKVPEAVRPLRHAQPLEVGDGRRGEGDVCAAAVPGLYGGEVIPV